MAVPQEIWIVGDSWVYWLQRDYLSAEFVGKCQQMNFELKWFGYRGMRWHSVVTKLKSFASSCHPAKLLIHCGGNDVGYQKGVYLCHLIKKDLEELQEMFPTTAIYFSSICERQVWRFGYMEPRKAEKIRRNINKVIGHYCMQKNLQMIMHRNISFSDVSVYRRDGVHLSQKGNRVFLHNILNAISS